MPARTKRAAGGAVSHHVPCETSARRREEDLGLTRSYFCSSSTPSAVKTLRVLLSLAVLLVTWSSLLGVSLAQEVGDQQRSTEPFKKKPSVLVLDTRPPPVVPWMNLYRRQNAKPTTTTSSATSSASLTTEPTPSDFDIPRPFDTALSGNFTASCAAFFRMFLSNDAFTQCHPFSLMLQTSSGLFDASKSFVRITQTLETTCSVRLSSCLPTMNRLAGELIADHNCAVDYANDNPQVVQAYNGLVAYEPLYQASCLRDKGGNYCYANAVTNRSAPGDSYPYYLPLGVPLPGGTRVTCNTCLQDAMAIFSAFAGNSSNPISQTYNGAAQLIGIGCGAGFVNQTATPLKGAACATSTSLAPTITLFLMLLFYFFQ